MTTDQKSQKVNPLKASEEMPNADFLETMLLTEDVEYVKAEARRLFDYLVACYPKIERTEAQSLTIITDKIVQGDRDYINYFFMCALTIDLTYFYESVTPPGLGERLDIFRQHLDRELPILWEGLTADGVAGKNPRARKYPTLGHFVASMGTFYYCRFDPYGQFGRHHRELRRVAAEKAAAAATAAAH